MNKRICLLILDGWGIGMKPSADAIANAKTPFMHSLWAKYPHTTLTTFGYDVGLPEGQMGNSEVGHLNLGAGRVVYQELARINKACDDGSLANNPTLLRSIEYAKTNHKPLHLLGLVSDGGVHSHINHLKTLVSIIEAAGVDECYIHAFTDGRDTDPHSGAVFLTDLQNFLVGKRTRIASLVGRYYAMDRDKRWERVKIAYDLLVHGKTDDNPVQDTTDFATALRIGYAAGISDEFARPHVALRPNGAPLATINDHDAVLFFNFRTDRPRELTQVLTQISVDDYEMYPLALHFATMTRYDESYAGIEVLFEKDDIRLTLGEVLERAGKTQLRVAETEKYPHVTFFFSGGREAPFEGEQRIMIPSQKVATYDLAPEMSAAGITSATIAEITASHPDFICLNYANTDMVGHTGVFTAAITAAETVDGCLAQLVPHALAEGYGCFIIADHGNSDYMINEDGSPNTAHTMNPVPCIFVSNTPEGIALKHGKLGDLAPTILAAMHLTPPIEMTGENLFDSQK